MWAWLPLVGRAGTGGFRLGRRSAPPAYMGHAQRTTSVRRPASEGTQGSQAGRRATPLPWPRSARMPHSKQIETSGADRSSHFRDPPPGRLARPADGVFA